MSLVQAVVLGLVAGAAQILPVSAGAHVILLPWLFRWPVPGPELKTAILCGAGLAVLLHVRERAAGLARQAWRREGWAQRDFIRGALLAVAPGVGAGLLWSRRFLDNFSPLGTAAALILFSASLWLCDRWGRRRLKLENLGCLDFGFIGGFLALSVVPGSSAPGIAIAAGMALGLRMRDAGELALLLLGLLIPGAALWSLFGASHRYDAAFGAALAASFAGAWVAAAFLRRCLARDDLSFFAVYRCALGLLVLLLALAA